MRVVLLKINYYICSYKINKMNKLSNFLLRGKFLSLIVKWYLMCVGLVYLLMNLGEFHLNLMSESVFNVEAMKILFLVPLFISIIISVVLKFSFGKKTT